MILTSIPFGNHYEYSDKYNDFGHNSTNDDFFRQMDFLVPELLRVLEAWKDCCHPYKKQNPLRISYWHRLLQSSTVSLTVPVTVSRSMDSTH
jgi:hypothetical protein